MAARRRADDETREEAEASVLTRFIVSIFMRVTGVGVQWGLFMKEDLHEGYA
jgi:hypothetical protein